MAGLDDAWGDEEEYLSSLAAERSLFAWTLRHYGNVPIDEAERAAMAFYGYEAPSPRRGFLFHDEAWHWAMRQLHGEQYWEGHPERATPSDAYLAEADRIHRPG